MFNIDEIIYGVAEHDGKAVYSMDQLSSASIEISSEAQEITDKRGNVVRTIYKTKTGTFTATNAFLHPQMLNAASGAKIQDATVAGGIVMPKITVAAAGSRVVVDTTVKEATINVIGIYGSGANVVIEKGNGTEPTTSTFVYDESSYTIKLPAGGDGLPVKYLIKYDRTASEGFKLTNSANEFPETIALTLYCSYVDPCDDDLNNIRARIA